MNICFLEDDIEVARKEQLIDEKSIVLAIHGCNELTEVVMEMVKERNAMAWAFLPCCISKDQYLGDLCSVQVNDQKRHALLCGAMALTYRGSVIATPHAQYRILISILIGCGWR